LKRGREWKLVGVGGVREICFGLFQKIKKRNEWAFSLTL